MLLPKLHLSHILKDEILPRPSANKHLSDALLGEPVVRHSLQGLLVCSHFDIGSLVTMAATAMAIAVMVVMMMMAIIMTTTTLGPGSMRGVRQEVDDHQDSSRLQPRRQPLRREVRVVEVVEAEPHDGEVEPGELGAAEGLWVFIPRHTEVSLERDHLIFGKALSAIINRGIRDGLSNFHGQLINRG